MGLLKRFHFVKKTIKLEMRAKTRGLCHKQSTDSSSSITHEKPPEKSDKEELPNIHKKIERTISAGSFIVDFEPLTIMRPSTKKEGFSPPNYFRDGRTRIDFVLVTISGDYEDPNHMVLINTYAENLKAKGLLTEFEKGRIFKNLAFLKIGISDKFVHSLASTLDIALSCVNPNYDHDARARYSFMQNDLNTPFVDGPIYHRSSSVSGDRPEEVTDAERIMIVHKVLSQTAWGSTRMQVGFLGLLKRGLLLDAYPLHDNTYYWTEDGPLSDRQLLKQYWAGFSCVFKMQPLNLIERYFGTDNAFYFAWLGFYIHMLTIAGALGVVFFIIGSIYYLFTGYNKTIRDVCNSEITMCPPCSNFDLCPFLKLKNSCNLMITSQLFDNTITIIFAIIMSFWATMFMAYWTRYESMLSFRWNVRHLEIDTTLRYEFMEAATIERMSSSGDYYLDVPRAKKYCHIIVTYATCFFMILLLLVILFGYIIYRVGVRYSIYVNNLKEVTRNINSIITISSGIIVYIFIAIFGKLYESLAWYLTRYEYHRTERTHDNSYIYKMTILSFANNYAAITYLAFFKGKFYSHPGEINNVHYMFGLGEDLCDPAGCLIDLTVQLASILIIRSIVSLITQYLIPLLKYRFNVFYHNRNQDVVVPHWEEDYKLSKTSKYYLIHEWTAMVIQYGFVTFYVAAFPLAPVIAWINNIIELRIDAFKMVATKKRPVPHRTSGIGPYRGILKGMTIAGLATNAFVLAFTTDFIPRTMFAFSHGKGHYRKTKLSRFAIADFPNSKHNSTKGLMECYYPGHRFPPSDPKKYQLTPEYWRELAIRFGFVILFEHVLVFFTGILAYIIPRQSYYMKMISNRQEEAIREAKNQILNVERDKKKKKRFKRKGSNKIF